MDKFKRVLDQKGWQLLAVIARTSLADDFYLAGGTGLALQLGHRKSYDLDFFRKDLAEEIPLSRIEAIIHREFCLGEAHLVQREIDQMTWNILDTKITFLAYPFSLLEPCVVVEGMDEGKGGVALATAREIALMKAYAIGRRATFRDYVDMYFILRSGVTSLEYILKHAPQKFVLRGEQLFSPRLFLEQLVYTKDIPDREQALQMILRDTVSTKELELFLQKEVQRIVKSLGSFKKGSDRGERN